MESGVAPGWFQDPAGSQVLRWWDGNQWTPHTSPLPPPTVSAAGDSSRPGQSSASTFGDVTDQKSPNGGRHTGGGLFGGKRRLEEEVDRLQRQLDALGATERDALTQELTRLRSDLPDLRTEHETLLAKLEPLRSGAAALQKESAELARVSEEVAGLEKRRAELAKDLAEVERFSKERTDLIAQLQDLRQQVVATEETVILQEVGLYKYRHPLDDAVSYKARLAGLQAQIKDSARAGNAVVGSTNWTVNGSTAQGTKMVREFSKLMLRAYNAEADNAVRTMKPYTLESAIARLEKARDAIVKLGGTMSIRVTDHYHQLRVTELELTADFLAKAAEEKEHERAERERLRDEERARREIEREQERLRKEQEHYLTVLATYQAQGNESATAEAEAKLAEIADGLDGLNRRAANIRAGYVYVISNVGAFGPRMVKIGMTRRLDPMDRVRELGDASVPFRYDVHALVFSEDAVGLETHLHHELAERRVNMVNARREFFYATPTEVRDLMAVLDVPLLSFVDEPEALEWRQSETARSSHGETQPAVDALSDTNGSAPIIAIGQ